jgi:lysophospholipid acyltransferase (LPLAT)-like uncharacterized protein
MNLTKASENNKAKDLTNVNQGVQIHNIWHSSLTLVPWLWDLGWAWDFNWGFENYRTLVLKN